MKNDEIEIKELLVIVYDFFARHKFLWLAIVIIAIIFAGIKYKKTKIYFNAEMVITSNITYEKSKDLYVSDLQPISSILYLFQEQVEKHNKNFLKEIGLKNPSILKRMSVEIFKDKNLSGVDPKNIKINVDVFDASKLQEIQTCILNYCNENEYIKNKFDFQKVVMRNKIKIATKRIRFIDTLEYSVTKNISTRSRNLFFNFNEWNSIVTIESERFKYNNILTIEDAVTVVQPFSKYPNIVNKKLNIAVVYFFIILFLGLVVTLIIELINYLRYVKK